VCVRTLPTARELSASEQAYVLPEGKKLTDGIVVTLFPDGGEKYLSEPFWEDGA